MRQKNIYLEKINSDIHSYGINWKNTGFRPKRIIKDFVMRRKCGYDYRITYNLDSWIIEQLYTWLNMYLEASYGTIDLEYHSFYFEDLYLTEFEAIVYILDSFENYLRCIDKDYCSTDKEFAAEKQVQKAMKLLSEILFALWW